ncbi:hypothetical protein E8E15_007502 [Penicillium rubens]|uniref:Pc13g10050 protein n=2 Tax=Penicillium chrysogenum species complex TaxID=254878 RepID=B6H4Q5_PENRW|nr:uncharacterized protein N7525_003175 [Penicillium rubens]KZN93196.1 hypothetical protein EN45_033680 [Penicillium chrysogenum]CAP92074.1 Pc13g10050 [Penicillium rubens Wisconsin 54-1255]KAF3030537.1 hypothetical protein E8E15_007502 [Penicillium rubens]KAJ5045939.1 hypothetical protein NUH16_002764 [Penicillium rubens]KAJ5837987.1 hypothetical protein N7525_003175 [Penicillium rubens]
MSSQTAPAIPPRPARSPKPPSSLEMPKIPPRPGNRRNDRSASPMRDSYAPSPFNEWSGPSMSRTVSNDPPPRPPSVTIPSLGEEGIEYADLDPGNVSDSHHQTPAETRNVSSDLKIHAPRPSLPTSSAEAKVQAVTRTDSRQAAAAGLGRGVSPGREEPERSSRSTHSRTSGSRAESSTASNDRRHSTHIGEEHGFRVPMYPNAGDVQAPSPSPYLEQGSQRSSRNHNRTRSARDSSLPPGSYGLHGHGVQHPDKFEKAWYEKHPDEFVKEEGQYGPGVGTPRPDWAMSSDDLNKIVRSSAQTGSGLGTSPTVVGTPEEEVGYLASDEYIHQIASPAPDVRLESQPTVESPLRQMSFPSEVTQKPTTASPQRQRRTSSHGHHDSGVIHVDDPMHPLHHPDGFAPTPALEENEPTDENVEEEEEPILAADEVRPEAAYLHPAVSPTFEHRGSFDDDSRSRTPSIHSRSNSRSTSAQGQFPVLTRYDSREDAHTPLEDVDEYEPLFPEDDAKKETVSAADRFKKRPDTLKHRFPSQDIWEDTPNSLQLHATVTTPDLPKRDSSEIFETPEQEATRRMQNSKVDSHQVATHILEGESTKEKTPIRPDTLKQRFPSRDIWEDAPDSHQLVTTIEPAKEELKSPEVPSKPAIPPRPQRQAQSTSPTEKRQPPTIPERPKPQVPTRPAKPGSQAPAGTAEASREAPAVKAKPAIPARPGGSKIAAMKAGFLTDLNSRLQLGPQQAKPQEKEPEAPVEKQPLSDARKGRARGPARRKPAVEKTTSKLPTIPEIKITEALNVWQVGQDGNLVVGTGNKEKFAAAVKEPSVPVERPMAPPIAKNTAGESVDPKPESPVAEDVTSPETTPADVQPIQTQAETPKSPEPSPVATEPAEKEEEKDDVSETKPSEPAAAASVLTESAAAPAKVNEALEDITASGNDKRESDGSIHSEQ